MAKHLYEALCNIDGLPQGDLTPGDTVRLDANTATTLLASSSVRRVVVPTEPEAREDEVVRKKESSALYEGELPDTFPSVTQLREAHQRSEGEVPDIHTYEDLSATSNDDLLKIHGVGQKSVQQMRQAMEDEAPETTWGDEADEDDIPA